MINEALRLVRVLHDYTSKQLASELGISPSFLSEIENGHKRPSIDLIAKYAEVFRTKPSVLLYFAEELQEESEAHPKGSRERIILFLRAIERFTSIHGEDRAVSN